MYYLQGCKPGNGLTSTSSCQSVHQTPFLPTSLTAHLDAKVSLFVFSFCMFFCVCFLATLVALHFTPVSK